MENEDLKTARPNIIITKIFSVCKNLFKSLDIGYSVQQNELCLIKTKI